VLPLVLAPPIALAPPVWPAAGMAASEKPKNADVSSLAQAANAGMPRTNANVPKSFPFTSHLSRRYRQR
jgi:hypothetical protein